MRSISHLVGWCFLRAYTVDKMITLHKKRCCLLAELKRIARMNNIQACAREIVDKEMIYA